MKEYLERFKRLVREDWMLMLVALGVAIVFWWNTTQRQIVHKFLPGVEVNLSETNLKPSLKLAPSVEKHPKVSVSIEGPRAYMESLTSDSFVFNPDLSEIQDATKYNVYLEPGNLLPKSHLVRVLPLDQIRIRRIEDINPRRLDIETVWNQRVKRIVPRVSGQPASGYFISGTTVSPATLTVAGSDGELEQRASISNKTEIVLHGEREVPDQLWTLKDFDMGDLEVPNWDPKKYIRLHVQIDPIYGERTFRDVQVNVLGASDETRLYDYEPKVVAVHVQGARSKLRDVTSTSFALEIGLSQIEKASGEEILEAKMFRPRGLPNGCEIRTTTPSYITVRVWQPPVVMLPKRLTWTTGGTVPTAGGTVRSTTLGEIATESAPPATEEAIPEVQSASGVHSTTVEGRGGGG